LSAFARLFLGAWKETVSGCRRFGDKGGVAKRSQAIFMRWRIALYRILSGKFAFIRIAIGSVVLWAHDKHEPPQNTLTANHHLRH
jgi:hypothetical protein